MESGAGCILFLHLADWTLSPVPGTRARFSHSKPSATGLRPKSCCAMALKKLNLPFITSADPAAGD
jgi:hypothetical protein